MNFPEFSFHANVKATISIVHSDAKTELLWIAEYERRGLNMAMGLLEDELAQGKMVGALRLFIDVTDLYGQVYLLKDIGTRTR